jgi:hypothetical protein
MTWPRTKKPRSSAQPAAHGHDSVHVAAAQDADPAPASGFNTGVSGTQHAPVEAGPAPAPAAPEIAHQEPAGAGTTGYDETSGIVYEVAPARGFAALGIDTEPDLDEEAARPSENDGQPLIAYPVRQGADTARDPGAGGAGQPGAGQPGTGQPGTGTAGLGTAGTGSGGQPAGGPMWNQTVASAPQPADEAPGRDGGLLRRLFQRGAGPAVDDDGPPPLTRVRDLPFDQRLRIWRTRALIVIVVGVVFAVIVDWEVGVTMAIVAGIADTIYRSRSAESHHVPQAGTIDRASWRAQRRTQKQLSHMERAGYLAIHRRPIPDSAEVIDHLVVGPTGVYAIDSEKWAKDMPVRAKNGKTLFHGPDSKKERLEHARWEAEQASERLSAALGREIKVRAALAIYGPKIPWDIAIIRDVDVFSGDRLRKYLNSRARKKSVRRLSPAEIQEIRKTAAAVLPLDSRKASAPVG